MKVYGMAFRGTMNGVTYKIVDGQCIATKKSSMDRNRFLTAEEYAPSRHQIKVASGVKLIAMQMYNVLRSSSKSNGRIALYAFGRLIGRVWPGKEESDEAVRLDVRKAIGRAAGYNRMRDKMTDVIDMSKIEAEVAEDGQIMARVKDGTTVADLIKQTPEDAEWVELTFTQQEASDVTWDEGMKKWVQTEESPKSKTDSIRKMLADTGTEWQTPDIRIEGRKAGMPSVLAVGVSFGIGDRTQKELQACCIVRVQ